MTMQLEARDKRALIGGAVAVTALLAYLLWPSAEDPSNVELVAAGERGGAAPAAPPMQVQPPNVIAQPVAPPPVPAAAVPEGLTLTGIAGSGAIFGFADGSQRFVGRGRDVAPGIRLQAVRLRDVILATNGMNYRLTLGGTAVPFQPPPATAPPGGGGPAPQLVVPGAGTTPLGGPLLSQQQQGELSRQFMAGLEPRRLNGQISGWTVKPGAGIGALSQAGLQPGDVLLTVNGEAVTDQEQVAGLSQQILNSRRVEFGFERNGQRMTRAIEVNSRR